MSFNLYKYILLIFIAVFAASCGSQGYTPSGNYRKKARNLGDGFKRPKRGASKPGMWGLYRKEQNRKRIGDYKIFRLKWLFASHHGRHVIDNSRRNTSKKFQDKTRKDYTKRANRFISGKSSNSRGGLFKNMFRGGKRFNNKKLKMNK